MDIVADAGAFIAVALNETERNWVIVRTSEYVVVSPEVLPYEIGNALISVTRKGRLNDDEVARAFDISQRIPVRLVAVDIHHAIEIAVRLHIHAYDAYYLQCCIENKLPLISLDVRMCHSAKSLGIEVVE